jgi:hypothetical protein
MVQYVVYYNFHVYKFGFYSHKNMLWLFEWKQSPRVLGFVCHYISIFLGSSSCDFQWIDRAIYIHEFGWTMLEVDEITLYSSKLGTFIQNEVISSQDLGAF